METTAIFQRLSSEITRRQLLSRGLTVSGWGAFAVVLGAGAIETVSFFFPRVLFTPPTRFRIGTPEGFLGAGETADTYGIILVDERWKPKQRFFVVRERERIYATSARCVHLGCTVNWFPEERIFKCPCHGSEYYSNGVNYAGPAPRPLDRFRIELTAEGELLVDTSIIYSSERFTLSGAFVKV